ncbi:MAG: lipoate--protein ligase, partial [Desulfovibrio sp.]|nr:lipoate--protein ligase [Desulfovibrio sp.]
AGRLLLHGTLLVDADLSRLGRVLTPAPEKRRAHAVASVGARVRNVAELWAPGTTLDDLMTALLARCAPDAEAPDAGTEAMAEALAERKYRAPEWNFGALAPATRVRRERFPWGMVELRLELVEGRIASARVTGDFFSDDGPEALEARLLGCPAGADGVGTALADLPWERLFLGCDPRAMRDFFASAVGDRP